MTRTRRRFVARRLALMLIVLAAGAGVLFAAGGSEEAAAEQVTIEYMHWSPNQTDMIDGIVAGFEEENPGITVETSAMVPSDYWTRVRLLANQNELPDVMEMSSGFLETWANDGFLYDLTPYVNDSEAIDGFYDSLVESARSLAGTEGYYALPYAFVIPVMFYNKDMFDAHGVDYPNTEWDWDDFLDAAETFVSDEDGDGETDVWGHYFYGRYAQIEPWIYANDGRLIDREAMTFNPDANAVEALQFLFDLVTEHEVSPQPKSYADMDTRDVFAQGYSAMFVDGSWNIDYMRDNVGDEFEWGIAPVPTGPAGSGDYVYGWSDFAAISEDTENPDEAWAFLTYLAGEGRSLENFEPGKIPAYVELAEDPVFLEPGALPAEKGILLELAQREPVTSFTKSWSEWRGYGPAEAMGFNAVIDAVLNGEITYPEAIEAATTNVNEVLDREYR